MSTQTTTAEMNRTICEFTGWEFKEVEPGWFEAFHDGQLQWADDKRFIDRIMLEGFRFHEDWNKLMPVVAKIPKLIHATDELKLRREMSARWKPIENELCNVNMTNVHYCLFRFIQWYNKQKEANNER